MAAHLHLGAAAGVLGRLLPRLELHAHTFQKIENGMTRRMPANRCCCFNVRGSFQLLATVSKLTQLSVQSSRLQESFFNAEQRPSESANHCGDIHGCYQVYARILMLPPCQRAHGHSDRRHQNATTNFFFFVRLFSSVCCHLLI